MLKRFKIIFGGKDALEYGLMNGLISVTCKGYYITQPGIDQLNANGFEVTPLLPDGEKETRYHIEFDLPEFKVLSKIDQAKLKERIRVSKQVSP